MASSAVVVSPSATTSLAGLRKQRIKYTEEMHFSIIPCYFDTMNTGTTSYRRLLHQRFVERFPQNAPMVVQLVANQYRFITHSDTIPDVIRECLRIKIILKTGDQETMGTKIATNSSGTSAQSIKAGHCLLTGEE